jgi:hypothetical protein
MDTQKILESLKAERDRIERAIAALDGTGTVGTRRQRAASATYYKRGFRGMSAEARRRISEAQKRRWAAHKKRTKKQSA